MKYVSVLGGSNAGKTTFAKKLAKKLNVAYIELDAINWQRGWQMESDERFRKKVQRMLSDNPNGWVVDGSYSERLKGIVQEQADTIILLQIPLRKALPRQLARSARRLVKQEVLWNGNKESIRNSMKLAWWILRHHTKRNRMMHAYGQSFERGGKTFIAFTSNADADRWLQ